MGDFGGYLLAAAELTHDFPCGNPAVQKGIKINGNRRIVRALSHTIAAAQGIFNITHAGNAFVYRRNHSGREHIVFRQAALGIVGKQVFNEYLAGIIFV